MTRIYQPSTIIINSIMQLDDNAFNHVIRVLRMREGDHLTLFDGHNYTVNAIIHQVTKKALWVKTADKQNDNRESLLNIHLGQAISRGEKMEFTIQKSVELGVKTITPLLTERCGVKLDTERLDKKLQQWQKIAESACEQCGRNVIPVINPIIKLETWCASLNDSMKITLHPRASHGINGINQNHQAIALLIGPEGGLSDSEIAMTLHHQFIEMSLGPRILRTETAALTALTALQVKFGDLG